MKPIRFGGATLAVAAVAALSGGAGAQVTHTVNVGPMFSFDPVDVCIQPGDIVQWVWQGAFIHNVESGVGGVHDGIFTSGPPVVAPFTYSVAFDSFFLSTNPVPGNVYNYYCAVHWPLFGMAGRVIVQIPGFFNIIPSPFLPPNSLVVQSGTPAIGQSFTLGVDNPLLTQPSGSFAFLGASNAVVFTQVPGFGMAGPGAIGEFILPLTPGQPILQLGPVQWTQGTPAPFTVQVPDNVGLVGLVFFFQGLMFDASFSSGVTFGLTEGLQVDVGNC